MVGLASGTALLPFPTSVHTLPPHRPVLYSLDAAAASKHEGLLANVPLASSPHREWPGISVMEAEAGEMGSAAAAIEGGRQGARPYAEVGVGDTDSSMSFFIFHVDHVSLSFSELPSVSTRALNLTDGST